MDLAFNMDSVSCPRGLRRIVRIESARGHYGRLKGERMLFGIPDCITAPIMFLIFFALFLWHMEEVGKMNPGKDIG